MLRKKAPLLAALSLGMGLAVSPYAQTPTPPSQPAPAGFDNDPNGFEDKVKFGKDRDKFEEVEKIDDGLGPVYNSTACVGCHQNPVTGSSSQVSEIRAGHRVLKTIYSVPPTFDFVEPPGGSLIHQRAIDAEIQEHVRSEDEVRTLRMSNTVLGNGFVEVLQNKQILDVCAMQHRDHRGMEGTPILVPVAVGQSSESGSAEFKFVLRLGRFGWKNQEASLLNFSANAYLNEMGITNPLQPDENKSNGRDVAKFDPKKDPEDEPTPDHPFGQDVEAFTRFMRSTKAPPRSSAVDSGPAAPIIQKGEEVFTKVDCAVCHTPQFTTQPPETVLDFEKIPADSAPPRVGSDLPGGKVPAALGNKIIRPFSDFMLHDVGTGDGIVQTQHSQKPVRGIEQIFPVGALALLPGNDGSPCDIEKATKLPLAQGTASVQILSEDGVISRVEQTRVLDQRTANMIRTAPLWGVRVRPQLLHDGSALTLEEAILRHSGQAEPSKRMFEALPRDQKDQLLMFLNSL